MHQQQTAFENIVEKEEIACNEQFLLFPPCFLLNQKIVSPFCQCFRHHIYICLSTCLQYKSFENTVGKGEIAHKIEIVICKLFEFGSV